MGEPIGAVYAEFGAGGIPKWVEDLGKAAGAARVLKGDLNTVRAAGDAADSGLKKAVGAADKLAHAAGLTDLKLVKLGVELRDVASAGSKLGVVVVAATAIGFAFKSVADAMSADARRMADSLKHLATASKETQQALAQLRTAGEAHATRALPGGLAGTSKALSTERDRLRALQGFRATGNGELGWLGSMTASMQRSSFPGFQFGGEVLESLGVETTSLRDRMLMQEPQAAANTQALEKGRTEIVKRELQRRDEAHAEFERQQLARAAATARKLADLDGEISAVVAKNLTEQERMRAEAERRELDGKRRVAVLEKQHLDEVLAVQKASESQRAQMLQSNLDSPERQSAELLRLERETKSQLFDLEQQHADRVHEVNQQILEDRKKTARAIADIELATARRVAAAEDTALWRQVAETGARAGPYSSARAAARAQVPADRQRFRQMGFDENEAQARAQGLYAGRLDLANAQQTNAAADALRNVRAEIARTGDELSRLAAIEGVDPRSFAAQLAQVEAARAAALAEVGRAFQRRREEMKESETLNGETAAALALEEKGERERIERESTLAIVDLRRDQAEQLLDFQRETQAQHLEVATIGERDRLRLIEIETARQIAAVQAGYDDMIRRAKLYGESTVQLERDRQEALERLAREAERKKALAGGDFGAGWIEGARTLREEMDSLGQIGADTARDLYGGFKDVFVGAIRGADDLGQRLESLANRMLDRALGHLFDRVLLGGPQGGGLFSSVGIPGFAEGGSFSVGGAGGVDSQLVAFKASPGERVDVTPPGGGGADGDPLRVIIVNTTGQKASATQRRGGDGVRELVAMVGDEAVQAVARDIDLNGAVWQAIERTGGVRRLARRGS